MNAEIFQKILCTRHQRWRKKDFSQLTPLLHLSSTWQVRKQKDICSGQNLTPARIMTRVQWQEHWEALRTLIPRPQPCLSPTAAFTCSEAILSFKAIMPSELTQSRQYTFSPKTPLTSNSEIIQTPRIDSTLDRVSRYVAFSATWQPYPSLKADRDELFQIRICYAAWSSSLSKATLQLSKAVGDNNQ